VHERRRAGDDGLAERLVAAEQTDTQVVAHDEAREIRAALDSLPEEQARVIELAYFGGFTHTEIAELLGAPVGTIKGRMRLGLEKLRGSLERSGALAIP
jgi:RNA polymerase sigma-70 factor (ECF subfamily)